MAKSTFSSLFESQRSKQTVTDSVDSCCLVAEVQIRVSVKTSTTKSVALSFIFLFSFRCFELFFGFRNLHNFFLFCSSCFVFVRFSLELIPFNGRQSKPRSKRIISTEQTNEFLYFCVESSDSFFFCCENEKQKRNALVHSCRICFCFFTLHSDISTYHQTKMIRFCIRA